MVYADKILEGLKLEPIKNLSYLSKEMLYTSNNVSSPDAELYYILLALFKNNLETYQISQDAGTDKLTEVLNRKYLDMLLEKTFAQARKTGDELSVILCDLDYFKQINDTYGHLKGDEVLREAARVITETIHGYGTLGRYGGEEFLAVLPNCGEGQAGVLAERIRAAVQKADILKGLREVTLSLGTAAFPQHANTAATLVEKADKAMYMAKKNGRNRYEIWKENFIGETAAKDITSEMLTGDAAKDANHIKALTEIVEILNGGGDFTCRMDKSLDKIIDTVGVNAVTVFTLSGSEILGERSAARREVTADYNRELINKVILTGDAVFQVDWDNELKDANGLPDWLSLAIAPMVANGVMTGVMYASVSVKVKELRPAEAGFICNAATLIAGVRQ